jgi:hypothetical protein
MSDVHFEILSPLPLNRRQDAIKLFQIWAEDAPRFFPDRSGLHAPLRHHFSLASLDEAIRTWEYYFRVKRVAAPKLEGNIFMQYGPHRQHSTWSIGLKKAKDFDHAAFCKILERAAVTFTADFGFIHAIVEAETSRGLASGTIGYLDTETKEKDLHVTSHTLWKFVPDIYWMTVFGKPYVELFSRKRLLSCPAYRTHELHNGSIVIQLTPRLTHAIADEDAFERARHRARNHLDNDAFFDPLKGLDYKYRVPKFVWAPVLQ